MRTELERGRSAVQYDCLRHALDTAMRGDIALAIVARAQLFEEYVNCMGAKPTRHLA